MLIKDVVADIAVAHVQVDSQSPPSVPPWVTQYVYLGTLTVGPTHTAV